MNRKTASLILGLGILAEAILVIFLFATGGVALTPLDTHQSIHPSTFGIDDSDAQATVQGTLQQLTAIANGTPFATAPGRGATVAATTAPVAIGQPVLVDGVRYTINSISDPEPGGFFKPPAGKRFVAIDLTVEAVSNQTLYGIAFVDIRGDDGKDYGWTNGNNSPVLTGGTLKVGEKDRGFITVQLPSTVKLAAVVLDVPPKAKTVIADLTK